MTLAYVDPATGRQGPQVRVEIPQMPWPVLADFEVGPDGVGMVEVRPDELHPDYTEIQDGEHDYRHFMVDVRRGFVAALEPEQLFGGDIDRPGYRLYVDAREQSHVLASYRGPDRAFVKQTLAFDDTGALIVSEDQNRDEETWRLVDCLARGLSPYDGDEMADQLQHLIASDRAGLYSEPGYSTPASGHCLWLGQSLIYVGSHGTSAGVQTNLEVLPGIGERDPGYDFASLYELNTGHFRPSLLSLTDRQVAFSALDLNDVLVIQDLNGGSTFGQWTPRHFQFPYRVGQAVLSPGGDLVAVEAPPFHASLPELRVTVLASALILEQPNDRIDEHDDLRFFVTDGPGGPELRDAEDQLVFELPPVVDSYTPLAYSASPDPAHPVVLASVDHRAVERFTRDEDGGWRRELLFVAPRYIVNLTLHPDGDLLIVGMALGGGLVEARIWSLSDRRAVGFLGENYKWMDFRVESDGSLAFVQTGAVATSVSLDEGRARAEAALAVACRPTTAGEWRSSPCWPGNL